MDISYFGPRSDFLGQAFFPDSDEINLNFTTDTPTLLVATNPSTGWQVILTGSGLDATTLTGTLTGLELRDENGSTSATFYNFSWDLAATFAALASLVIDRDIDLLEALFSLQDVNFDGSSAVEALGYLILQDVTSVINYIGTPFDDGIFVSGAANDSLSGGDGDDTLAGRDGNDTILGEAGDDHIYGNNDDDRLICGDGDDEGRGGAGDDTVLGGAGDDRLYGEAGRDRLVGDVGNDRCEGGADADTILGMAGDDTISGGDGNDRLLGGNDHDEIFGGFDNDVILAAPDGIRFMAKRAMT
ncbi:MAG: hypothetical protein R3D85_10800 [Paracoccaceae bacterium]